MPKTKAGTSKSSQPKPLSATAQLELTYRLQHTGVNYDNNLPILSNRESVHEYLGWLAWCIHWREMDFSQASEHIGKCTHKLEDKGLEVAEELKQAFVYCAGSTRL